MWVMVREIEGEFFQRGRAETSSDPARLRLNLPRGGAYLIVVGSNERLQLGLYTLSLDFVSATEP